MGNVENNLDNLDPLAQGCSTVPDDLREPVDYPQVEVTRRAAIAAAFGGLFAAMTPDLLPDPREQIEV